MDSKITVTRVIGKMMLQDVLRILTIITAVILGGLLIFAWWLTTNVSAWWGALLAFVVICIILAGIIRQLVLWGLKQLYPTPLTAEQHDYTKEFVGKLRSIAETRSMGWPLFIVQNIKDIIMRRDLTNLKKLIGDTKSLRQDFKDLEDLFKV